jgi:hypothetical protein
MPGLVKKNAQPIKSQRNLVGINVHESKCHFTIDAGF